jgi:hypothetical protein
MGTTAATGEGAAAERFVFVNCPYDPDYKPLMDAIVLATVACGFVPRTATDSGDVSRSRMDRIDGAMRECRYSIHDLSRCTGSGDWNHARFNMPLELGMGMAMLHDWLVLVPTGHDYTTFVSDLAGYDLKPHDQTPQAVIRAIVSWLSTRKDDYSVTPGLVIDAFERFEENVAEVEITWGKDLLPFPVILDAARKALEGAA